MACSKYIFDMMAKPILTSNMLYYSSLYSILVEIW